ncbi:tetratricopeptide repeat protein 36 [Anabrus simplex]|uniref:tetratricopeptide repeat protein 36 n=1 Tax=Anabrus simplex TaxID=316456 RepID=UPI0035A312FF
MSNENDKVILNSIFNPLLPIGETISCEEIPDDTQDEIETDRIKNVKCLEVEGVKAAESGDLDEAIDIFTRAIQMAPEWASGYNNRAQAFRLKGISEDALADLDQAIALSGRRGRAGCQAFCQRGLIHRKEGRHELAKDDFEAAAALGSEFAKAQLVQLNPYAALCNKMLHSVMLNLRMPEL